MRKTMKVPSGRWFDVEDLHIAKLLARVGCIQWRDEPFKLRSGARSRIYISGRNDLTENPDVLLAVGSKIAGFIANFPGRRYPACIIGIPTAGTSLALAASLSYEEYRSPRSPPFFSRIMREKRKDHGLHKTWVDGAPNHQKHRYFVVDNTATNGESKFEAAQRLREDGYDVNDMHFLVLVDRQQGAMEQLAAGGLQVSALYNILDLSHALVETGVWPKKAFQEIEEEIAAHRVTA